MVDIISTQARSRLMAGIRSKNTRPEIIVRKVLHSIGYRFRLHRDDLPGSPDIVLPGRNIAIFVHGCFWHRHAQCRLATLPATRREFWNAKFEANVNRDQNAIFQLRSKGWRVLLVWECSTKSEVGLNLLRDALQTWIEGDLGIGQIGA